MASLFIIGNGFDLAHGLKTRYEDFHKYLNILINKLNDELEDKKALEFLIEVIDDVERLDGYIEDYKWSNLEESLNFLDFTEFLEDFNAYYTLYGNKELENLEDSYDEDYKYYDDEEYHGLLTCTSEGVESLSYKLDYRKNKKIQEYVKILEEDENQILNLNQEKSLKILSYCSYLYKYFSEWINTIELDSSIKAKKDFYKLINFKESIFINFNYTKTLEHLYRINPQKICYIHGVQNGEMFFGHGNNGNIIDYTTYVGCEDTIEEIYEYLRKDTEKVIAKNKKFFNSLSGNTDKIYSFGFSFSEVDLIYIKKICKSIKTEDVTWYINDYDENKGYRHIIKACGFKGEISVFKVKE